LTDSLAAECVWKFRCLGEQRRILRTRRGRHDAFVARDLKQDLLQVLGLLFIPVNDESLARSVHCQLGAQTNVLLKPVRGSPVHYQGRDPGHEGKTYNERSGKSESAYHTN
jgi:hypothetical protein